MRQRVSKLLREVQRGGSKSAALDLLCVAQKCPSMDHVLHVQVAEALSGFGLSLTPKAPWQPGIGEAYVLLYGAVACEVAPLRVDRLETSGLATKRLGGSAQAQVEAALFGLATMLRQSLRGVPRPFDGHRVDVDLAEPAPVGAVVGASLGLAASVAALSLYTNTAPLLSDNYITPRTTTTSPHFGHS